jgi:hypothetical protein
LQKLTGPTQLLALADGVAAQADNSRPVARAATASRADRLIAVRNFIDIVERKKRGVANGGASPSSR